MDKLAIIVLAAGKGTRMGASLPKVLFKTSESSLLGHVLDTAVRLTPEKLVVVTGYKHELVEQAVSNGQWTNGFDSEHLIFAYQEQQLGTGDAVRAGLSVLQGFSGTVLVLSGDVPLVELQTLQSLLSTHANSKATLSFVILKGHLDNTYGKVIRDLNAQVLKIVEHRDCSEEQKTIDETNAGIYAVDSAFLEPAIIGLINNNEQKEFYLTDIVERAIKEGQTVASLILTDHDQVQGVNTQWDLHVVNRSLRHKLIKELAIKGVVFEDPDSAYIESSVQIAPGVKIGPNSIIKGKTSIAADCVIEGSCHLEDCELAESVHLRFGVRAAGAKFGKGSGAGPFAHIRPVSELGEEVHIGNFVEVKNSKLDKGTKAGHLAYLGDASIAENVNIGAGTIIANYDGVKKHKTVIGQGASIGSNSVLVAPIEIGNNSTVGAGSVVSKNVAAESLVLTRAPVKVKSNWSKRKK